ncbi:GTP-binding protein Era [Desulfotomaculum arcticum]|uniref:GTPase Era n=1 Tax=Desulfotruncus arcticus DSM 17038 TaxID=1121424 RepID=A0A1I2XHD3_9FIRM|nr:GTPase Era [Desulfotruncus arcticus]SFH12457.1 GTP-binding protein Era [Desulfotomaculum arcticum] [Desulfotruncus arcticus DSM 17038]
MNKVGFKSGFVTITGRTNVGKSTLLNRMVGQKVVIMSDKPQTTRHKIQSVLTGEDYQVVFIDTPGIHKPKHKLGERMVETALKTLREVDIIMLLVEAVMPGAGDNYIITQVKQVAQPVILVINKIDLVKPAELAPIIAAFSKLHDFAEIIPVSALTGENVERLHQAIVDRLPEGPQYYPDDVVVDRPERFIMAELIREKVLHLTSQEVPHSVAVVIEEVEQRSENLVAVSAIIYTERESQKGILIGKGGRMLKEVGKLAREEIEALLGSKIFLELWVKVKKDWRNHDIQMKNFGFVED